MTPQIWGAIVVGSFMALSFVGFKAAFELGLIKIYIDRTR